MKNQIRITLRLPADLYRQVVALADEDERSMNSEIIQLLRLAVEVAGKK